MRTFLTLIALLALADASKLRRAPVWRGTPAPQQDTFDFLPLHVISAGDYALKVDLPAPAVPRPVVSNAIDKPVMESQEILPPQSVGAAILPQMPPPATPVDANNVPANGGAVFLGSGSIGVVSLGNGAYALGSGSIGYSGNRAQPRPSAMVPVYPPLAAAPNLIPAAVPSPGPVAQVPNSLDFNHPYFNTPQVPQYDQNGYEYLPPNRVGFGMPNPPRPPRVRQQFATPTALQVQPQMSQGQPQDFNFDFGIPLAHPSTLG